MAAAPPAGAKSRPSGALMMPDTSVGCISPNSMNLLILIIYYEAAWERLRLLHRQGQPHTGACAFATLRQELPQYRRLARLSGLPRLPGTNRVRLA